MRILGEICLLVAFIASGYSSFACLLSLRERRSYMIRIGVFAAIATLVGLTGTVGVLARALMVKDFDFEYVAHYSSQLLPSHYSLSALWVGQAGSLLLWTWLLLLLSFVFLLTVGRDRWLSGLSRCAFGVLMANVWFLVLIMVFAADPMKASLSSRRDGLGLSPLLQHPSMLIHPPVIFLGYAAWTIPFALAVAALVTGELDSRWTRLARPWSLFAWTTLGAGLLLGAHWAYQELGWGGYWGWDPVENGSLIPWLTGTASIHCLMAWRYRGCLKKMAVSLAILTFGLCNFATFLTRSGIFSSVHAFSQSPIGWMFLGLMSVLLVGGAGLVMMRRRALAPDRSIHSVFSREAIIVASTYLLLILTVVVIAGTLYTPISMVAIGRAVQIGPAFYNNVFMPISILLLTATAVVPLIRWGTVPHSIERRALGGCAVVAMAAVGLAAVFGVRHPAALAVIALAVLMVGTTLAAAAVHAQSHSALSLVARVLATCRTRRRQYGAYVIHLGLAFLAVGVTGSSLGTQRHETELSEGQTIEWGNRRIEYARLIQREDADKLIAEAELHIAKAQEQPVILLPARHFHLLQNQWTTEVAIDSSWKEDFYTILNAGIGDGRVVITFIRNPLMRWIWFGGWLAGAGVIVAAWPRLRKKTARRRQVVIPEPKRHADARRAA